MARPKETDEVKVKKVYPDARVEKFNCFETGGIDLIYGYKIFENYNLLSSEIKFKVDEAWQDALTQIRKAKIKAANERRKQAKPVKVKEIKKHVGLTMYPSDKAIIVKGFGSVQKFLDSKVNDYKLTIKTK